MLKIFKNKKSTTTFILSFVFSILIIFAGAKFIEQTMILKSLKYDLNKGLNRLNSSQTSDRDELKIQLTLLREELIKYKSQQEGRDQILGLAKLDQGSMPTPTIQVPVSIKGIIKLKENWEKAEVYQEAKASSKVIGKLVKDKLYFIYEEDPSWYKIEYDLSIHGWVQKSLVDEL